MKNIKIDPKDARTTLGGVVSVGTDITTLNVNLANLSKDEGKTLLKLVEKANSGRKLFDVPIGDIFKAAGIEFIRFGYGVSVTKDVLFDTTFDKDTNDFSDSELRCRLEAEVLHEIEKAVGANNVLSFKTDLFSLDGTNRGVYTESKISLPTLDFYRANREIFDKHHIDKCWWLTTPDSTNAPPSAVLTTLALCTAAVATTAMVFARF